MWKWPWNRKTMPEASGIKGPGTTPPWPVPDSDSRGLIPPPPKGWRAPKTTKEALEAPVTMTGEIIPPLLMRGRGFVATPPELVVRNKAICDRFKAGATMRQLGTEYGITFQRVGQILHKAGLKSNYAPRKAALIPPIVVSGKRKLSPWRGNAEWGRRMAELKRAKKIASQLPAPQAFLPAPKMVLVSDSPDKIAAAKRLVEGGLSINEASRRTGVSKAAMKGTPSQHGKHRPELAALRKKAVELYPVVRAVSTVATMLGVSATLVRGALLSAGIKPVGNRGRVRKSVGTRVTDILRQRAALLYDSGKFSQQDIAARLGISRITVTRAVKLYGHPDPIATANASSHVWTDEKVAVLKDLWGQPKWKTADIANLLEVSYGALRGKARRLGL